MSRWYLGLVAFLVVGCSPTGQSPEEAIKPKADDHATTEYKSGPDATEWLMNTKHTLKGLTMEQSNSLIQELLGGAVTIHAGGITSDANDPSFSSASTLIVEMPSSAGKRKEIIDYVNKLGKSSTPVTDTGQKYIEFPVPSPS